MEALFDRLADREWSHIIRQVAKRVIVGRSECTFDDIALLVCVLVQHYEIRIGLALESGQNLLEDRFGTS